MGALRWLARLPLALADYLTARLVGGIGSRFCGADGGPCLGCGWDAHPLPPVRELTHEEECDRLTAELKVLRAAVCTCGHGGLDRAFHLGDCPVRVAPQTGEVDA